MRLSRDPGDAETCRMVYDWIKRSSGFAGRNQSSAKLRGIGTITWKQIDIIGKNMYNVEIVKIELFYRKYSLKS